MTMTISIAVSILLTVGAIGLALEEDAIGDLAKQVRVECANVRARLRARGRRRPKWTAARADRGERGLRSNRL